MGDLDNYSEVIAIDIIGELYRRGLDALVEKTLACTNGHTVTSCFQVCSFWEKYLRNGKVWRRIIERKFSEDTNFRFFCRLNGWMRMLPSQGGREVSEDEYKQMVYKSTNYAEIWTKRNLNASKLSTGGLFSCLKLHQQWLFVGMLEGTIQMWDVSPSDFVKKPMRIFKGHTERVSSLDSSDTVLVSGSIDHSVRVWNIESSTMLRVFSGSGSPILLVKLLPDRLAWCSRSGSFQTWSWKGPESNDPKLKFQLDEDPTTCNITVGEHYVVVAPNVYINEQEVIIYSSYTGQKMLEKRIFSSAQLQCIALQNHLLFIGAGSSIEIWDIKKSLCVAVLGSNFRPIANVSVIKLSVSDFQLVAMLSNGHILHWPLRMLVKMNKENPLTPLHYNLEKFGGIIENKEPPWKNLVISDSRIAFGLEMNLGEVKIFNWSNKKLSRKMEEDECISVVRRKTMSIATNQSKCQPQCPYKCFEN